MSFHLSDLLQCALERRKTKATSRGQGQLPESQWKGREELLLKPGVPSPDVVLGHLQPRQVPESEGQAGLFLRKILESEPELRILQLHCARSRRLVPGPGRPPSRTRGSRPGCRPGSDQSIRWGPAYGHKRLRRPLLDPTGRTQSADTLAGGLRVFAGSDRVEAAWGRPRGRTPHPTLLGTERAS